MINQDFFLKEDEHKAKMENDCILCCLGMAEAHYKKGNYVESSAYYVNAARSLEVLENLKQRKFEKKITRVATRVIKTSNYSLLYFPQYNKRKREGNYESNYDL